MKGLFTTGWVGRAWGTMGTVQALQVCVGAMGALLHPQCCQGNLAFNQRTVKPFGPAGEARYRNSSSYFLPPVSCRDPYSPNPHRSQRTKEPAVGPFGSAVEKGLEGATEDTDLTSQTHLQLLCLCVSGGGRARGGGRGSSWALTIPSSPLHPGT